MIKRYTKFIIAHFALNCNSALMFYVLRDIGYKGPLTMEFMPRLANPYESGDLETKSRFDG